jgi:hypothetical protein
VTRRFSEATREALDAQGWRRTELPGGLTLAGLHAAGVPFKGDKASGRPGLAERPLAAGEMAYRPGLMPGTANVTREALGALLDELRPRLPTGVEPAIGSAAAYGWLLAEHQRRLGEWLLARVFTWTADDLGGTPLAIGVFGGGLLVSPLPEGRGAGVGLLPLLIPADSNPVDRVKS